MIIAGIILILLSLLGSLILIVVGPILSVLASAGIFIASAIPLISYSPIDWQEDTWSYAGNLYEVGDGTEFSGFYDFRASEDSMLFVYDKTFEDEDIIAKSFESFKFYPIYKLADEEFSDNILHREDGYTAVKQGFTLPDGYSLDLSSFYVVDGEDYYRPEMWKKYEVYRENKESFRLADILDMDAEIPESVPTETAGYISFDIVGYESLYFDLISVYRIGDAYYANILEDGEYVARKIKDEYFIKLKERFRIISESQEIPGKNYI
jgi:hypothetical protein